MTNNSTKHFKSNPLIEGALGTIIAPTVFLTFSLNRELVLLFYKPTMAGCILTMLIGQLLYQANWRTIEFTGGVLIRISKITASIFFVSVGYLMITLNTKG